VTVLRSGSATDVGRVRKVNQDLPLEAPNLFAVADGMGGHVGGEVAAKVAVDALLQVFSREPTKAGLEEAFSKANRAVWQESLDHRELRGMGTTLTAVALVGDDEGRDTLALANVGDSRAYLYSGGRLVQISADHSVAEERMRHGEITEEEAAVHPQRHILTRALGISSEVETDMWELQLRPGDRVMLCSDGLSNELSNERMANVLATELDPIEAAHQLVELANEHGGSDNITVIVVDVLVGEESAAASVITPIGERAGPPLIVVPDSEAPGTAGAGSGLTGLSPAMPVGGSGHGDLLLEHTQAVPVARATVRSAAVPLLPQEAVVPPNESRGARRRRLGIPRRITLRVVLFILLVAAIPTVAFFAIRWYAYDNWFIAIQKSEVVVKQGHPGGVLWFHPRVVDKTKVTTTGILSSGVDQIRVGGVQEPSLQAAKHYVANLHDEYLKAAAAKKASQRGAAAGSTTTTFPGVAGSPHSTAGTTTTVASGETSTTVAAPTTTALTPAVTSTITPATAANTNTAATSPAA
jgi:PPM family protein phosphatase